MEVHSIGKLWIIIFVMCIREIDGNDVHVEDEFKHTFTRFLSERGYNGGAVGIMKNGVLQLGKGFGVSKDRKAIQGTTLFPISSISQTFTAVAVYQLIEGRYIEASNRVFGVGGLLHMIKPYKRKIKDKRILDITVDHLLRHTAGWDPNQHPLYDPMLNQFYLHKGFNVTNLSEQMKLEGPLMPYDIISYLLSNRLDYTPGTKQIVSNVGYNMLGRIIEEASDTDYKEYIKINILEPCGMWNTKLGPHDLTDTENDSRFHNKIKSEKQLPFPYAPVDAIVVDSSLGWYSDVYDVMRFMKCLDSGVLISDNSIIQMMRKPDAAPVQHTHSWIGAGWHADTSGNTWQNGYQFANDLILYHQSSSSKPRRGPRMSWVILLDKGTKARLKHEAKELISTIQHWTDVDRFWGDLTDTFIDSRKDMVIKYNLEEHQLRAYAQALKDQKFDVTWISAFWDQRTYFSIIAEKVNHIPITYLEAGLSEEKLIKHKMKMEQQGYNLTLLQNYKSASHSNDFPFLVMFKKNAFHGHYRMKYGTQHFKRPYKKLLELFYEKGYHPSVQSVVHKGADDLVSFILLEDVKTNRKVNYKSYMDLTMKHLIRVVKLNAIAERRMSYLGAANNFGKPRFSAVFTKTKVHKWQFRGDLSRRDADEFIQQESERGFIPNIIISVTNTRHERKYVVYLTGT